MDALIIYQYCTFGGVERVILNRAEAFRKHNLDVKLTVGYLFDSGALESFKAYIQAQALNDYLSAYLIDQKFILDIDQYNLIFVIDTPQILDKLNRKNNVFVECHTHYQENRQYLRNIPKNIRGIIVPSLSFKTLITDEFSNLPSVSVLPHPVPDVFFNTETPATQRIFTQHPLTYFGRLDELKNFSEASQLFDLFVGNESVMYIIIGYGADDDSRISSLEQKNKLRKTLIRGNINFKQVPDLIQFVKQHRGIFLSPSKGESFGLSAAEFMCGGVPVLLSDIPAHCTLVEDDERFIYPLGDIITAKDRIVSILDHWDSSSLDIQSYAQKFKADTFLNAWENFVDLHYS